MNNIYHAFDEQISNFDAYKVETINDKYMVVSGLPKENGKCILIKQEFYSFKSGVFSGNRHADEIARLSLTLMRTIQTLRDQSSKFPRIYARIGIHSGNTVAGVVGSKMPRFCLFGDTINLGEIIEA